MIAILDYEMGNLHSVAKAVEKMGGEAQIIRAPEAIQKAERLIVPGVGAFRDCMGALNKFELVEPLKDFIQSGRPYLGLCLGMQILMDYSTEGGQHAGLGIFPGKVERFSPKLNLKVPHMGWNRLTLKKESKILKDLPEEPYVYFVHSYYVAPTQKEITAATTDYGIEFTSVIEQDNIFAVQFHPEKSQKIGLKIIENFVKLS